jgi:peroxiredoxin
MKRRSGKLEAILGLLALGMTCFAAAAGTGPDRGSAAPDFELQDTAGESLRLSSLKGEVVLLHFWATWCPHCLKEMPLLASLSSELSSRGARVVAINLGEPRTKVIRYLRAHHLDLRVLLDPRGNVAKSYGVLGLPATVVVDATGRIEGEISMGGLSRDEVEKTLTRLRNGSRESGAEGEKAAGSE